MVGWQSIKAAPALSEGILTKILVSKMGMG